MMIGPRARYVVVEARPIDSRIWHDRWRLSVRRVPDDTPVTLPALSFVPYGRGEGPADFAPDPEVGAEG